MKTKYGCYGKRFVVFVLMVMVFFASVLTASAAPGITVNIDGQPLQFDVSPTIIEGRTLVPLRGIFEALGAEVEWDNDTRTVTGRKENAVIVLIIGDRNPTVNGVPVTLDVPGTIVNGRTMVPARFIAESLGARVDWIQSTGTVAISSTGIPAGAPVIHDETIIQHYKQACSLEKQLFYGNETKFSSREQVYQQIRQGYGEEIAGRLTDYYWVDGYGLMGGASVVFEPESPIHILRVNEAQNEAVLWHLTSDYEMMEWGLDPYTLVTMKLEGDKWKIFESDTVSQQPR